MTPESRDPLDPAGGPAGLDDETLGAALRAFSPPAGKDAQVPEDEEGFLAVMDRLAAQEAVEDPDLRCLMAEVADAVVAASSDETARLGSNARAAAIGAWQASVASGTAPTCAPRGGMRVTPERTPKAVEAPTKRAPGLVPALRWAALGLLVLGAGLYAVVSSSPEASARLRLTAFYRLDHAAGRPEATWGRMLRVGEQLQTGPDEVLALRLSDRGAVVLQGDSGLSVIASRVDGPCSTPGANLRLGVGEARLMAGDEPVCLALPDGLLLIVEAGRGLAASAEGRLVVALADGARGRILGAGPGDMIEGPVHAIVTSEGLDDLEALDPDRFRVPAFLDELVDASRRNLARLVDARRWRVLDGASERRGRELRLAPATEAGRAEVAWRPAPFVRRARTLRVVLRGEDGVGVRLPGLGVDAFLRPDTRAALDAEGFRIVDLALPDDWYERLRAQGDELVIALVWPEGTERHLPLRFLGTEFRFDRMIENDD